MEFILVYGINYYLVLGTIPAFVQHKITFLTNKFGNDLDAGAPYWARHKANQLLTKYGVLNA